VPYGPQAAAPLSTAVQLRKPLSKVSDKIVVGAESTADSSRLPHVVADEGEILRGTPTFTIPFAVQLPTVQLMVSIPPSDPPVTVVLVPLAELIVAILALLVLHVAVVVQEKVVVAPGHMLTPPPVIMGLTVTRTVGDVIIVPPKQLPETLQK
jgi:hypothetical protein